MSIRACQLASCFSLVLATCFVTASACNDSSHFVTEACLREYLVKGHDRRVPPGRRVSPTVVNITFVLIDLFDVDQQVGRFTIDMYFRLHWIDPRLAWGSLNTAFGYDVDRLDMLDVEDRIWLPDVHIVNAVRFESSDMKASESLLDVFPDGSLIWSRRVVSSLRCPMDFHTFPFDKQNCEIRFALYRSRAFEAVLNFRSKADNDNSFSSIHLHQWHDFNEVFTSAIVNYSSGQFAEAYVKFEFTRFKYFWIKTAIVPSVIFALISYSGYWIDPAAAPGRITLATICVLIATSNMIAVTKAMPVVSYSVWLVEYLFGCIYFNVLAVFTYAFVNFVRQERSHAKVLVGKYEAETEEAAAAQLSAASQNTLQRKLSFHAKAERVLSWFWRVDWHMRWIWPLTFLLYNIFMFFNIGSYKRENEYG